MQKRLGNRHMPWKRLSHNATNALSDDAIAMIARRHDLPPDRVAEIGGSIVNYLSYGFTPLGLFRYIDQSHAGEKKRAEIIKTAKRAIKDVENIRTLLCPLRICDGDVDATQLSIAEIAASMDRASEDLQRLEAVFAESERKKQTIFDASARNKRRDRDEIRPMIVGSLMAFWMGMGRRATITTDASRPGNPRSGAFFDFVRGIILELTDPPTEINDETFRKDVQSALQELEDKKFFAKHGLL
jgi:hypothetical protein